jgi:hypothetical protein
VYELHEENYFFAQEVGQAMSKGLINYKSLRTDFRKYVESQNHARLIKDVRYGEPSVNASKPENNIAIADKIRKQRKAEDPYPIKESAVKTEEYLFYQICYPLELQGKEVEKLENNLPYVYDERNMLIFLCHGFQAWSADMLVIERGIKEALPFAQLVLSESNESDTDCNIEEMGERLACEVK